MMDIFVKSINFTQDKQAIFAIWRTAFPKDAAYVATFLTAPICNTGLILFENDQAVAMALFLPCTLHISGKKISARYVYGVATLPHARGKGYASRLLREGRTRFSADLLYLHPATTQLESFYRKQGYFPLFYTDTVSAIMSKEQLPLQEWPFDVTRYRKYPRTAVWPDFPETILTDLTGDMRLLTFPGGGAVMQLTAQTVYVSEVMANHTRISALTATLQSMYPGRTIELRVPGVTQMTGMVLPLSAESKKYCREGNKLPFTGLFFDK